MASGTPQHAPRWRRFALLVGAAGLALLASEAAARLWGAMQDQPGPAQFLLHDDRLGWRNRPDFAGQHVTRDFAVAVCFDADGARCDNSHPAPPPAGAGLVLAIGDSTTFGWGVAAEATFAARLGGRLGLPVRNFGVSGYGSDQQLLQLEGLLRHHRARLVIVTHQDNDVAEVLQTWAYGRHKPVFEWRDGDLQLAHAPVPRSWLGEYSHLWRTLRKRLGAFETPQLSDADTRRGRELVRHLYRTMQQRCAAKGAHLLLVAAEADWLVAAAAQDGIPCCDLGPTLAELRRRGPVQFAHDPHWLPAVHGAVAEVLANTIAELGLAAERRMPSKG